MSPAPTRSIWRIGLILMLVGALALVLHYSDNANGAVTAGALQLFG